MEREIRVSWCHLAPFAGGHLFVKQNKLRLDYILISNLKLINFY